MSQLQALFNHVSIWEMVTTCRFNRQRTHDSSADIYDGALYHQHWNSGFLNDERNISFIYNSDSVPVFKSSEYCCGLRILQSMNYPICIV